MQNITVVVTYSVFEIAAWPLIRFIYPPGYISLSTLRGTGVISRRTGIRGARTIGIITMDTIATVFPIITHIIITVIIIGTRITMTFITVTDVLIFHDVSRRINEGRYKATYSHPEQRREGEALYSKVYANNNKRTQDNTVNGSQERRSVSQQTQGKTLSRESSGNKKLQH